MFPICAASLPSSSSFSVSCALSCFFPLTGLYWNKSLVTHTAVFLWVSQANFDTLIMPSLSLSVSLSSPLHRLSLSLSPDLPPSPDAAHWAVQYITVKAASLSLEACQGWRVEPGPQTNRLTLNLIRCLHPRHEPAETAGSDTFVCSHLPCTMCLCVFQSFSSLLAPCRTSAGQAWSCLQCMPGEEIEGREGGRCLWQCGGSNEGPYYGETISKAWTLSPLARAHTHRTARE